MLFVARYFIEHYKYRDFILEFRNSSQKNDKFLSSFSCCEMHCVVVGALRKLFQGKWCYQGGTGTFLRADLVRIVSVFY